MENYIYLRINSPWKALELLWKIRFILPKPCFMLYTPSTINKKKGKNLKLIQPLLQHSNLMSHECTI